MKSHSNRTVTASEEPEGLGLKNGHRCRCSAAVRTERSTQHVVAAMQLEATLISKELHERGKLQA